MSEVPTTPVDDSLRRAHRSVLVLLACCALVIATRAGGDEPPPDAQFTVAAIVLALGTIAGRRLGTSERLSPRARARWVLGGFGFASTLGLLAVALAFTGGGARTALAFVLAAAIFCVRPPPRFDPPAPTG